MGAAERRLFGVSVGGLAALALAIALVAVRGETASANVALALVLPVIGAAAVGRRLAGATTALVAAGSFDFFHTEPYLSLTITSSDDIETTALLLLLGLAAGQLAGRAMTAHAQRRAHLDALSRLGRVSDLALQGEVTDDIAREIAAELVTELGLRDCWYEQAPFLAELLGCKRTAPSTGTRSRLGIGGFELPREGSEVAVMGRGGTVGRFVLLPTPGRGVRWNSGWSPSPSPVSSPSDWPAELADAELGGRDRPPRSRDRSPDQAVP